jgi:hypothetical protein
MIFQQLMRTLWGQYFNHRRWDIISEPQENKMQLKFFACPTGKYYSAYSLYTLNESNLALKSKYWHNMKKFMILSFYPVYDAMSEKPSHATVPLKEIIKSFTSLDFSDIFLYF